MSNLSDDEIRELGKDWCNETDSAKPLTFGRYVVEGGNAYRASGVDGSGDDDLTTADVLVAGRVCRPLPSTPATYALLQAAWCEHFGVRVGTRVYVKRPALSGELGWRDSWTIEMTSMVGTECRVVSVDKQWIILAPIDSDDDWGFPFHVLEVLLNEVPPGPNPDGSYNVDAGHCGHRACCKHSPAQGEERGDLEAWRNAANYWWVKCLMARGQKPDPNSISRCNDEAIRAVVADREQNDTTIARLTAEVERLRGALGRARDSLIDSKRIEVGVMRQAVTALSGEGPSYDEIQSDIERLSTERNEALAAITTALAPTDGVGDAKGGGA